jgi:acyl dehydratase
MSSVAEKKITVPEFQSATITDEMMQKARELIGVWLRRDVHWPAISEPISQIDIRRWAVYSVGDDNPLWCDADYAKGTIWGKTIAPPTFLYTIDTTIVAPGLPGIQWIYWGTRWEHFKPVKAGDQITARARVIELQEKSGKHVARFAVQTGEVIFVNQREEVVSRAEADVARIPRGRSGQGMRGFEDRKKEGRAKYSNEEIEEFRQAYLNEERRGSTPRYWEEVTEGEALPKVLKGPMTLVDIMAFYAGRRSVYNPLKLAFLERERHPKNVYVSPETGIPIHPAAGHFDVEIAHEVGMPGAYDQGWMRINWAGHLVTNWIGDWGFVRKLNVRLLLPNLVGDITWLKGKVTRKLIQNGEHLVELDCWGENQRGEKNLEGIALVRLPSKDPADRYTFQTRYDGV